MPYKKLGGTHMGRTIAVANLKGGVGKTMTSISLGVGLARQGKRVLCLDADPQHSLTVSFGVRDSDTQNITLSTMMSNIISETEFDSRAGVVQHTEGVDLLPSNGTLAGIELALAQLILGRETILRQYIDMVKPLYDYVIVDCAPSLDLLTINSLVAADSVIIPVVPKYLDAKGLELLLKRIAQVRRQLNPSLSICGILLTMVDQRANHTRAVTELIKTAYGENIRIFSEHIPRSVRAAESSAHGISIFSHEPNGRIAAAYASLAKGVLEVA
jgi:chromosome partitioning protein